MGEPLYRFPATTAQQAFWYLDRLKRGNSALNIAVRFRLDGPLDPATLKAAINRTVHRQEALRTTFAFGDDEPEQVVHASADIALLIEDLSALPAAEREQQETRLTVLEAEEPFSLEQGPLLRARLLRLTPEQHILLITVHHIVADGWSIGVLTHEISAHYAALRGEPAFTLPELSFQFGDYAVWHAEQCSPAAIAPQLQYWKQKLAALPQCEVPSDYPRPEVKSHGGHIVSQLLPRTLTDALTQLSRANGVSLFATVLAALKVVVAREAGEPDVYIGTLVAGRDQVEFEPLIGLFVNTLVLRDRIEPTLSFVHFLAKVQSTLDEAMEHRLLPFAQLVGSLRLKFDRSRHALFGINFIYQRDFVKTERFAGLTLTPLPSYSPGAIYDLNFFMVERADGWRLSCEYDLALYKPQTVQRLIAEVHSVLAHAVQDLRIELGSLMSHASYPPKGAHDAPSL